MGRIIGHILHITNLAHLMMLEDYEQTKFKFDKRLKQTGRAKYVLDLTPNLPWLIVPRNQDSYIMTKIT